MNAFALITLILGIVEPSLAAAGVIPPAFQPLAQGILAAVAAVKTELTNATGQLNVTAVSLIASITAGLQALQTAGALPGSWAGVAVALATAASAGTAAGEVAAKQVDPTTLQPIAAVA